MVSSLTSTLCGLGLIGWFAAPVTAPAQMVRAEGAALGGVEFRRFSFGADFPTRWVRQVAVPIGIVVPFGRRFTVDLGGTFASTTVGRDDGSRRTVSKPTDTQVRGRYTFGRDLAVATVLVNLPTGPSRAPAEDFSVLGAVSSSFLS